MITKTYASLFQATIYAGLRNRVTNYTYAFNRAQKLVDYCCRAHSICLSLTPTEFFYPSTTVYNKRHEPGIIVGVINYPRFPLHYDDLVKKTNAIAEELLEGLNQCRVSYVTPEGVCMLSNPKQIRLVTSKGE